MRFYRKSRVYIYECDECGEEVRLGGILRCAIEGNRLCKSCKIGGLCHRHYYKMNETGKKKAKRFEAIENSKVYIYIHSAFSKMVYGYLF